MLTYLIRRLLLIVPTLVGMAAIVFAVTSLAPGGIEATVMPRDAQIKPEERAALQKYLNKRYGLDSPKYVQFGRWLNKISPLGFATYPDDNPRVLEAEKRERELEAPTQAKLDAAYAEQRTLLLTTKAGLARSEALDREIAAHKAELRRIAIGPDAGDAIFTRPRIKWPDLGESFVRRTRASELLIERLPVSISLQAVSLPVSYALAVFLGIHQARKRGKLFDVGMSGLTLMLWCIPVIWLTVLLLGFLASEQYPHLRLFPTTGLNSINEGAMRFFPSSRDGVFQAGWLLDRAYHMVLPTICLTYTNFAFLSRLARGALLDNLGADFVRTARAKGLPERIVLYRHAFRASLIPLLTVLVNILPGMVVGSVVVETAFGINGMGSLAVDAAKQRDFELLLSLTVATGLLQLVAYLLADIGYAMADPRVSFE
jgi:ABC-type dipeptide/oligopeptide/nickel transport system permease component